MESSALAELSKLSEADQRELNQVVQQEGQQAMIAKTLHRLTDMCWKKCITGRIASGKMERAEEGCAVNCVERFMDTNMTILKHLEDLRGEGGL